MRAEIEGPEVAVDRARASRGSPSARRDHRRTPVILPAVAPSAGADEDWRVLVAALQAAEETWADFLEGHASVFELVRAHRQIELLCRRRGKPGPREPGAPGGPLVGSGP